MGGEVVMITWKKKPLETLIWIKKKDKNNQPEST